MGHSRGGSQAAWYAVKENNPIVKAVVLLAPATGEQQSAEKYQHKYGKPLAEVLQKAKNYVAQGKGDTIMSNTDFIYCKKAKVTAASFVDYYEPRPEFDTPTLLQKIKKPTLVIMGTEDQVVPDLPARMKEVNSKWVKVVTIEDADHSFLDFASEDTAQAIADFIQEVLHK
jgi:pimeloyl-ACP methyl ester carboxylesterase